LRIINTSPKIKAGFLSLTRVAVDTTKLREGMYVAKLDRPWVETPFVFQGFAIRDRSEIEQLQSCCSYVYVDIHRGKLTEAEIHSLLSAGCEKILPGRPRANGDSPARGLLAWICARIWRDASIGRGKSSANSDLKQYPITSTVRREAPRARAAYEHTLSRHKAIVDRARIVGEVNFDKVARAVKPAIESILRNPDAMAWTIFSRKRGAHNYSRAVATSVWSVMFGRHLGFTRSELQDLAIGGLLLDIGNVGVPGGIVNKAGAITIRQFEHVVRHVEIGLEILGRSGCFSDNVLDMVRCHHERADGSGYPKKKVGDHIPIFGRIAAIADCYDAMTTKTLYSPALAAYDSARELNDMRGREFEAELVAQFLRMIGTFPTGSVVEFSDGFVGIVLEQNRQNPLRPKVMLLKDSAGEVFEQPQVMDMQKLPDDDPGSKSVSIIKGHEHGAFGIDPLNYFA
jgi:HD-GYP domain-containing protein (c-di-GMP phosphodiesterase class II)